MDEERDETTEFGGGEVIVRSDLRVTAVFVLVLALGVLDPGGLGIVSAVVALMLFGAGTVTFLWAYALAIRRSRTDDVSVAGLYLLSEGAPKRVRRLMLGALGVQCVSAIAAASARPFTALAFGLLVPVFGLGMNGLWAARHGVFRPRPPTPPRRRTGTVATRTRTTPPEDVTIGENAQGESDAR